MKKRKTRRAGPKRKKKPAKAAVQERSSSWRQRDRNVLWHPFTQHTTWEEESFPVIDGAEGSWLVDVDGRRYLDGGSSMWCCSLGHGNPWVRRAIKRQVDKLEHATFLGLTNPPAIELAERLLALVPPGLSRVFYSDNGSTAVEIALKMALQYWGQNGRPSRAKFVALTQAYHGDTTGAMSVGGVDLFLERYRPLLFPVFQAPATYSYRCAKASTLEECGKHCLAELDEILSIHVDEVCGVILEPLVQGAGGMIVQPPGFAKAVENLCRKHDVFLVVDEVMTGFGRTGRMFACEHEDVRPDLMVISKGVTGGFLPLAATLATERIFKGFLGEFKDRKALYHGHTYTGNPLGCAAALGVLESFKKDRVLEPLPAKIEVLRKGLMPLVDHPNVGEIRQRGLLAGIEIVKDRATKESFPVEERTGHRIILEARKRGAILRPLADVLVVMPPLTSTRDEIRRLTGIVAKSVHAVLG
ncbi:MAG: adenosylmethionine--8-amino-7-oxononanoate transaminase [Planctomycetes bacterium]|nr:adenosylmethionine--8-amino-7-oxononanoate transaminase [Planctomycetota bacterium]